MASLPSPSELLARYVVRNARYVLDVLAQTGPHLSDQQVEMALQALDFTLERQDTWPQARALLLALAPIMENKGHDAWWQHFLESGLAVSQEMGDEEGEMYLRYHLGILWSHRARYEEAIAQHERGLALAQRRNQRRWQVRFASRLASHGRHLRRWEEAEAWLRQAQALIQPEDLEEQGYLFLVQGAIALDRREWKQAYAHFRKSLAAWQACGDNIQIAKAYANLGLVARRLQRIEEAETYLRQAVQRLETSQNPRLLAVARMNLGALLADVDRAEEGLVFLREAEAFFRRVQDPMRQAMTAIDLGRAYYALQEWEQAVAALSLGRELWQGLGNLPRTLNAQAGLAAACARHGEFDRARALIQDARLAHLTNIHDRRFLKDAFDEAERILRRAVEEERKSG